MPEPLGHFVSFMYRYGMMYLKRKLAKYNVSSGHVAFLAELYRTDGISQDSLVNKIGIDRGTTARALQKLEDNGYIFRVQDPEDRRVKLVYLTRKAKDFREDFYSILFSWDNAAVEGLSEEEVKCFLGQLEKIKQNAERLVNSPKE
jgi:DNA-binding MarR family transcriptional regulator